MEVYVFFPFPKSVPNASHLPAIYLLFPLPPHNRCRISRLGKLKSFVLAYSEIAGRSQFELILYQLRHNCAIASLTNCATSQIIWPARVPVGCVRTRGAARARTRTEKHSPRARRTDNAHCIFALFSRGTVQIVADRAKLAEVGKRYFLSPDAEPRERSAARVLQQLHHGRLHSGGALEASAAPQAVRVNAPPRRSPRTLHDFDHGTTRDASSCAALVVR